MPLDLRRELSSPRLRSGPTGLFIQDEELAARVPACAEAVRGEANTGSDSANVSAVMEAHKKSVWTQEKRSQSVLDGV